MGSKIGQGRSEEWVAHITEHTDVVVGDSDGLPSPTGVAKAVSIVQSRAYLEARAQQLLLPFTNEAGNWKLVTLDFGAPADLHECEFLMCFAFQASGGDLSITSPYVEIGFYLVAPIATAPLFVLSVKTAIGFPR